uniref:small monomeric GTPase n=1 Tax=Zosterops lateralis melanops TaxID=1220523 RepID=A0A8D2PP75_ZOSLA
MPWVVALTRCPWAGIQLARSGTRPSPSSTTGGHRYGGSLSWCTGEGKLRHNFGVSTATSHPLQGIFLVYDISSERSYQHIVKWASDVDEYAPDGVQKILIGNKADEEHKRQVPKEQGLQLAKEYGMDFYETSACSNLNIKESFTRLTELVLQAHRKELDELRGLPRAPTLARLEEDEQQPLGSEDTPKTCWC